MVKASATRPSRLLNRGFSLVEPLLACVILAVVASGTALMMMSTNRISTNSDGVDAIERSISMDLASVQRLSRRMTCCSGSCLVEIPTNYGPNKTCAVNNPDDDRYFFPQLDDPATTINEPAAVDALCTDANNTIFMTPVKTAVDATASPTGITRTTTIKDDHTLQVSYAEVVSQKVRRVALVVPPMALWCP